MYIKAVRDMLKANTATAALAAIGTPATAAELRAGRSAGVRLLSPRMLKDYVSTAGTTAERPEDATVGFAYFDTTLGMPVWLKAAPSSWVDATGKAA